MRHVPKKILYVEDEPDIREITVMALEMFGGCEVLALGDGATALAKAHEFSPDLLLTDFHLPDQSGPSLLQAMRKLPGLEELRGVLLTGKMMSVSEVSSFDGLLGSIPKPYDPEQLFDQLLSLTREHAVS